MTEYTFDLHFHSCLSPCGSDDMTPATIAGLCAVSGIQIAALTDHNSCENCEAFLKASRHYGVLGIPGMELATAEEVHVICLFPQLDNAMEFSNYVKARLPKKENRKDIFGNQFVMDEEDSLLYECKSFLAAATDIDIYNVVDLVSSFDGFAFPAHIDRPSFSLLSNMGMYDADMKFNLIEVTDKVDFSKMPDLPYIINSDAHYINQIMNPHQIIELKELSTSCFFKKLKEL